MTECECLRWERSSTIYLSIRSEGWVVLLRSQINRGTLLRPVSTNVALIRSHTHALPTANHARSQEVGALLKGLSIDDRGIIKQVLVEFGHELLQLPEC